MITHFFISIKCVYLYQYKSGTLFMLYAGMRWNGC